MTMNLTPRAKTRLHVNKRNKNMHERAESHPVCPDIGGAGVLELLLALDDFLLHRLQLLQHGLVGPLFWSSFACNGNAWGTKTSALQLLFVTG